MSYKGAHVQDSCVLERRLRPIYDWLDAGNYKKAIQECDKVLKKSPNLDRALALKALSLLRSGKESSCITILDSLTEKQLADDAILQVMTMCYRELQQLEKVSQLYEVALKVDPTNEELHTHLFMSYVRSSDFKQQQKAAMALYKLVPKNPYYCWAVMSALLQAIRGEGVDHPKKKSLLLSLAERMIDKLIQENKLEAEQEVQLYIMVLEAQEKYDKVLEVLDSNFGTKLSGDLPQLRLVYLKHLNRWPDINVLCKKILSESVDRWQIWLSYLKSVFELYISNNHSNNHQQDLADVPDLDVVDDTPEKAHEFICKLVENGSDNGFLMRGPYLARFELCKQMRELNKGDESAECLLGDPMELFIEYFRKFGHKPCCVSDLREYLELLDGERRLEMAGKLIREVGITSTNIPQTEQQMQRHICALQLSRLCGSHANLSAELIKALVTALSYHYLHGHQEYGAKLLSTDQAPADAYTLLGAHFLYDLHRMTGTSQPLLLAIVLLKYTLKNSPCNFHLKLLLLRLYHILGSGLNAQTIYDSLDIKHLQFDSMGYAHCSMLSSSGNFGLASTLFDTTVKFFITNYKDSSDHLTFSYKYGSFSKLSEFMNFQERLGCSFHYANTLVEKHFVSFVHCNTIEQVWALDILNNSKYMSETINWDKLIINHNYNVYVSWDPERINGPIEEWKETKDHNERDSKLLYIKCTLLDCMQSALSIFKAPEHRRIDQLKAKVVAWKETIKGNGVVEDSEHKLLCMRLLSKLGSYMRAPYLQVLGAMFDVVEAVYIDDMEQCTQVIAITKEAVKAMTSDICEALTGESKSPDVYITRKVNLEHLSYVIEILSNVSLLCLVCWEIIKNSQCGASKKAKKKVDNSTRESITNLVMCVKEEITKLDEVLKPHTNELTPLIVSKMGSTIFDDLNEQLTAMNLSEEEGSVADILTKAYAVTIKELRTVLKTKSKFLSCIS
ncbi:PREDICTED: phagocyte signaling-impaired protein [Nicrophorus vespilloides]|uniref:N-terminal acetyltransferase B complex subunit MDM20 homolog n=1 Tax=Nicrophorus vespilloides TaxID=110193 RepID=A0ABM1MBK8_NICVS|nr:PREDICTED: phagocyte signaling-impaired protein [Nicrophorus vespilloides]